MRDTPRASRTRAGVALRALLYNSRAARTVLLSLVLCMTRHAPLSPSSKNPKPWAVLDATAAAGCGSAPPEPFCLEARRMRTLRVLLHSLVLCITRRAATQRLLLARI